MGRPQLDQWHRPAGALFDYLNAAGSERDLSWRCRRLAGAEGRDQNQNQISQNDP
jgi:hypothetical protein